MLALLRSQRTFRLLLVARATSTAGDSVLLLALPYFLFVQTGSVVSSAGVYILAAVPNAALGPLLGSLADRLPARRLLIGCDLVSAIASTSLLWVTGGQHRWVIYVAAFVLVSCGQTVSFTRGAVTPRVVPPEQLQEANSLESAALSLVRLAAPPLGGLLYAVVGLRWLVVFNALTFAASACCVAVLRLPGVATDGARGSRRHRLGAIGRLVHPRGVTGRLVAITGGYFLMSAASTVLLVPYVRTHFRGDALSVGWLSASGAAGALVGAVLSIKAQRRVGSLPALGGMLVLEGLGRLGFTAMPSLVAAAVLVVVASAGGAAFLALLQTALQQSVPVMYVGRVIGLTWLVAGWCSIGGMLLFSSQARSMPLTTVLQESAAMCLALGIAAAALLRGRRLEVGR